MLPFNTYITEIAKAIKVNETESTFMEQVIIDSWNIYNKAKSFATFKKNLLDDGKLVYFIQNHKTIKFSNDLNTAAKELFTFAQNLHQKAKFKGTASSAGKDFPKMSKFWRDQKHKEVDTSKADILIGKKQISVKNIQAQLMSGARDESRATVLASLKGSGLNRSLGGKILDEVEKFAGATETEGLNTKQLKALKTKDVKGAQNKKAKKVLNDALKVEKTIIGLLDQAYKTKKFQNNFAFEAMTGWEKFGGKTFGEAGDDIGRADVFLIFSNDLKNVKIENIDAPEAKAVTRTAKKMKLVVAMKSSSIKKKVDGKSVKTGYRFFQTVRLGVKTVFDESDKLQEEYDSTQNELNTYLTEHSNQEYKNIPLNEIELIKKLGDKLVQIKNKIVSVFKKLVSIIKDGIQKIKEAISQGMEAVWEIFNLEVQVSLNTKVNLL